MIDPNSPPGFFAGQPGGNQRYSNPYYSIPMTFMPKGMDQMLWWANHWLFRHGFYRTAMSRVSQYFITALRIECDDSEAKRKYEEIFDDLGYRHILGMAGLNALAYGNVFASVTQGFNRFLICNNCKKVSAIDKVEDYKFTEQAKYTTVCTGCKKDSQHAVLDKSSKDLSKINVTFWNPREVSVRHEPATNDSEYYWMIPEDYIKKVTTPNNRFYSKRTPAAIYDAINRKKALSFNDKNFVHLKVPTPSGLPNDGKAIPFCIYLFDDFFMLKVLERYNQALLFEDIIPFRVFSMADGASNPQQNSVIMQNGAQWKANVQQMIQNRRNDPGSYAIFPFTLNYQQLGADAKQLAPAELMQFAITNILNALNIPQEMYTMNLQVQAMGPALRLFENSWSFVPELYNQMLGKIGDVISKVSGLPKAKISLLPVTLSDDIERKSIIGQLVSANAIARSELLNMYGFDFREQVRKKQEEDNITKELKEEQDAKAQLDQMAQGQGSGSSQGPQDVLEKAQEMAQQLFPLDAAQRRVKLQEIKAQDATLYAAVKQALDDTTKGAKSDGLNQAKQQGQNKQ